MTEKNRKQRLADREVIKEEKTVVDRDANKEQISLRNYEDFGINDFLKSLNLESLGLSEDIIQDASQANKAFRALGIIKSKLLENSCDKELKKLDKFVKRFGKKSKGKKLFPNEVSINGFPISAKFSDPYSNLLDKSDRYFRECFQNGKIISIDYGKQKATFGHSSIDPNFFEGGYNEFVDFIENLLKPSVIQHWCCLWNWAHENNNFIFSYVSLNDILRTVYTPSKQGRFSTKVRKSFSDSLNLFHNTTIELPITFEVRSKSGKKKIEQGIQRFRLFDLTLASINKKSGIYSKIIGEILPGLNPGKFRGRFFPKGIFRLDANKDGTRILLAYRIANRLDQMDGKPLRWTLDYVIRAAGLETTSSGSRGDACRKLRRSLEKLVEVGCLDKFEPQKITNKTKNITLFPI